MVNQRTREPHRILVGGPPLAVPAPPEEGEGKQKTYRRNIDWEMLRELIDAGCYNSGILFEGRPSYRKLSQHMGGSVSLIHNIMERKKAPGEETLMRLADYFGDDPAIWLEAGGYTGGKTALEERFMRHYTRCSPDEQRELIARMEQELRARQRA